MRLLFVLPEYLPMSGGGIITYYCMLLPALVEQGHTVRVIAGSALSPWMRGSSEPRLTVEFLDPKRVSGRLRGFDRYHLVPELQRHLAAAWTAWDQADRGDGFDVVETTDWGMLFVPWVVSRGTPPVLVQLHGSIGQIALHDPSPAAAIYDGYAPLIEAGLLKFADELQTYSHKNAEDWRARTGRDVSYAAPPWSPPLELPVSQDEDSGLVVARVQNWKGVTVLCESLRLLGADAPRVRWVGRSVKYGAANRDMAQYLSTAYPDIWGKYLVHIGARSPRETARLQASAAFTIVPSLWDVFNFTCVEAMAYGQVVLCSEGAGAAELIDHGTDGLRFPANDPKALADSLDELHRMSPEQRQCMGQRARRKVAELLAPEKVASQRTEVYEALTRRGRCTPMPDWLNTAVTPAAPMKRRLAPLDALPLRELIDYVGRRGVRRSQEALRART